MEPITPVSVISTIFVWWFRAFCVSSLLGVLTGCVVWWHITRNPPITVPRATARKVQR